MPRHPPRTPLPPALKLRVAKHIRELRDEGVPEEQAIAKALRAARAHQLDEEGHYIPVGRPGHPRAGRHPKARGRR